MPGLPPRAARGTRSWLGLLLGLAAAVHANPLTRPKLEAGETRTIQIRGGDFQAFEIELAAGQVLRLEADQTGADVELRAFGPDESPGPDVDDELRGPVSETLFLLAEKPGVYCVEVFGSETGAPPGRVQLHVGAIRTASSEDRLRAFARQASENAHALWEPRTNEGLRLAVAEGSLAASVFHDIDDPADEGRIRAFVGSCYTDLSNRPAARAELDRALELNRRAGDRYGEAQTLNFLGVFHHRDGDGLSALPAYLAALAILREAGCSQWECQLASNLGWLYLSLGEDEKSEASFREAMLAGARVGDDEYSIGVPLMGIGSCLHASGEDSRAVAAYRRAIAIFDRHSDPRSSAYTYGLLGNAYDAMGDTALALEAYLTELTLCRLSGDESLEAMSVLYVGRSLETLGDRAGATALYERSLDMNRRLGQRGPIALSLTHLGSALADAGQVALGREYLEEALSVRRQLADSWGEVQVRLAMAKLESRYGDLVCARHHVETALALEDRMRRLAVGHEARTRVSAAARGGYELSIDVLMRMHAREPAAGYERLAFEASEASRAKTLLELLSESVAGIREGVNPVLLDREKELKQRLSGRLERQARLLAADRGGTPEGQEIARVIGEIQSDLGALDRQIRASSARYAALTRPSTRTVGELRQALLDHDTVLLEYSLGDERSFVWALSADSLDVAELPKRSEIERLARSLFDAFARPAGGETQAGVRLRRRELEAAGRVLLGPVASRIRGRRIVIVPDGALQYVPFAALVVDTGGGTAEPLVVGHEVSTAPSASVLASIRREAETRAAPAKLLAVLADPVFEPDDSRVQSARPPGGHVAPQDPAANPNASAYRSAVSIGLGTEGAVRIARLPYSRREASGILAGVAPESRFEALDFEASRRTALDPKLGGYRFVHFATHGFFNNERPELSGLVLSLVDRTGRPVPGFLSTADVFNLRLPADLVVLSGCQTALGKESRGEGIVGLTRGFFYAGAQAVVASLWKVDDAGTAELMKHFYGAMLGARHLSPAAALREAQLAMRRSEQWSDPVHWAAFVLQGNGSLSGLATIGQ